MPDIGTICMQKHIKEISKNIGEGNPGVIFLNPAAWHTTKKLKLPSNILLLPLLPASPELNPTEQVWQALRDRYLANRCFDSYEQILDCCCDVWNAFTLKKSNVSKLCTKS